jgi:DNA-directed RNA polymerase subunit RPC12/RpoP
MGLRKRTKHLELGCPYCKEKITTLRCEGSQYVSQRGDIDFERRCVIDYDDTDYGDWYDSVYCCTSCGHRLGNTEQEAIDKLLGKSVVEE